MRASSGDRHISGAEGLYSEAEVEGAVKGYLRRALRHDRGEPDRVVVTVERVPEEPLLIETLPVHTVNTLDYNGAWRFVKEALQHIGVSEAATHAAISVVLSTGVMRGAALVRAESGLRVEPDRRRGVRVTRMGARPEVLSELCDVLGRLGIDRVRVSEALVLASKVASCPHIVAEICVSDDPSYTTGYVSSRTSGYLRAPHLKEEGAMNGGRVFFVAESCNVEEVIQYLEETPVMVTGLSGIHDTINPDEFFRSLSRYSKNTT